MKRLSYNKNDIIGKLIFVKDINDTRPRKAEFQCPLCNKTFITEISRAKSLNVVSCGCFRRYNSSILHLKHGNSKNNYMSPEYVSWQRMIQRCENINYGNFHNYGGRGIKVCERWRNSFENFLKDMNKKPFKGAHIDRIDVNGNYEPSNCRWVSVKENARNRRNNKIIKWNEQERTLSEWSEILKINKNTLLNRLNSRNWSLEESMTLSTFKKGKIRDKTFFLKN